MGGGANEGEGDVVLELEAKEGAASPRPPSWAIGHSVFSAGVLGDAALPRFSMSGHEPSVQITHSGCLDGEGGLSLDAGVALELFGGGWGWAFGLTDHSAGEFFGLSCGHEVS